MTYRVVVRDNNGKVIRVVATALSEFKAALASNAAALELDGASYYVEAQEEE